jgi:DNA-binding transcriptional regulator YdaS (Cro superfamily)
MRTEDAIEHFGSQAALARALGIRPPSIADWGDDVPPLRQLQLERLTKGELRADPAILEPSKSA